MSSSPEPNLFPDDDLDVLPLQRGVRLELLVRDPEAISALQKVPEGNERSEFALRALQVGLLAFRQAQGQVDADAVRRESERMLDALKSQLATHSDKVRDNLANSLKEYFDPESGRFQERVERLVRKDGDLERVLRTELGKESNFAQTMNGFVGKDSPLMKMLDPDQAKGVLASIRSTVQNQLTDQQELVLGQFSLDNEEGALTRLVKELKTNQGDLTKNLGDKITSVVKEFSLDEEDSALSRLVRNVDRAQKTITSQFSLDEEGSALARLKRELSGLLKEQQKSNLEFQQEVTTTLNAMKVRKEESERSTRHGIEFEDALCEYVLRNGQSNGDIVESTGATVGRIKNCKVGDCVMQLGPESTAAGARIVLEAKEDASYTIKDALLEIERARNNRDATTGIFVFSSKTAPTGTESFRRYGDDIVIVWDAEDPATDLYLDVSLTLARALSIRIDRNREELKEVDVDAIDRAVMGIEKRLSDYDDISKYAETICSSGEKIKKKVDVSRKAIVRELETLKTEVGDLKIVMRSPN
jgi:hypothetical protein